ncbi:alpha-D-ribose 1-methylphosphonate 5-triphosphate synthase subunit PhnH [Ciceribacter lividus]|uniref:Alpha-D-ribose 1-methylphosphonate 5-triphosphate synthase subunit PhnH n=1 Tax=Ciceribacter lividus TaxID=1197950 RepID=A0A6I7HK99_9HYPH|nr:phosphonate C-P lyase system protein PhnH [Ciceribacter lividus]RCW23360.1 alpha-D-ribose 1-methylphosphonate 5-triphosphate synthase subunit PhnH [Ciceribacter lividus]
MTLRTEALTGGYIDPVHDAQSTFRMLMDGMARPGTTKTIVPPVEPPAPLGSAAGAIALALCDNDTPVWLSASMAKSLIAEWIGFHTGAPVTREKSEARFAFFGAGSPVASFGLFALGSQEYPDRSTTVIIEIAGLERGPRLTLTGPGIRESVEIAPVGLPDMFLRQWADNRALFPRGIDVVLTAGRQFLCLPRTCNISTGEI